MSNWDLNKILPTLLDVNRRLQGNDLLKELVIGVTKTLGIKYGLVGRPDPNKEHAILTDVAVADGQVLENFSYDLAGTPCLDVFTDQRVCLHSKNVANLFPEDLLLEQMGVEDYIGAPIIHENKSFKGLFVLLHDKPIHDPEGKLAILCEFVAGRISSEFARIESEEGLFQVNRELENIVAQQTVEIQKSIQSLENSYRMNQQLLATIYHDIANPLMVSSLMAERAKMKPEKAMESLDNILTANNEVKNIINNVRTLVHSDSSRQFQNTVVSIKNLIDHIQLIFKHKLDEKGILLDIEALEDYKVLADETMLKNSVLANIVSNAIKFSDEGSQISISAKKEDDRVVISIQDQTPGIPTEVLENLEARKTSRSTKGTHNEAGTGFGLLICKTYLEKMKGNIEIESCQSSHSDLEVGNIITLELKIA
ncbi:MAG: GAF domain-containing sensor histidine kinase [Oligoflexia bacterium]|nr:GAF domain-containing sensor histidine kinase [Oligoflexia bacterium]